MRAVWQKWVPRVEDYWETFSLPYRQIVTDLLDKHTPVNGSVLDFGCGAGVQAFLLRQRRPDILIHAVDVNPHARNLTRILMGNDQKLTVEETPLTDEAVPEMDTIVSVFTCSYLEPDEVGAVLTAFKDKTHTVILAEPTALEDQVLAYAGMPSGGYCYPYGLWYRQLGMTVETILVGAHDHLNAVTVATRPPREDS